MNVFRCLVAQAARGVAVFLLCLCCIINLPLDIQAQTVAQTDEASLKKLSLEELGEVLLTSAGKRPEKLFEAAAAVYVITKEEIRRSGVRSIPEALRLANGVSVGRTNVNTWQISSRGFGSNVGDKMQVLFDGRTVYSPLFNGVFWDVQDTLLEDIERIEVIRGPGATLWGSNAVNGVINIITKKASDSQGVLLVGGGGTEERGFAGLRYGATVGRKGYYRVYSKYDAFDAMAFPIGSAQDPAQRGALGFRMELEHSRANQFTIQGDVNRGNNERFGLDDVNTRGGNIQGRWKRTFADGSEFHIQADYVRSARSLPPNFDEVRNTFDIETQHNFAVGMRQQVVWGVSYRDSNDRLRPGATAFFDPAYRTLRLFSVFAQDEFAIVPDRLHLILGSKFEHNSNTAWEVQPTVRLAWTGSRRQLLWGGVSRAVRAPSRLDTDLITPPPPTILGNKDFKSEELLGYEMGYRIQPHKRLSVDFAAFSNYYDHLRSQEASLTPGGPLVLGNTLRGHTYGAELGMLVQILSWWQGQAFYNYLQDRIKPNPGSLDVSGGRNEVNDPRNQSSFRSYMDLPKRLELDVWVRQVSARPNPVPLAGYVTFDTRLGWKATRHLELSIAGQNLPARSHGEFRTATRLEEVQRGVYGKVTWTD